MIWAELGDVWQRAMTLAWTSFCEGNLPIAAVLTDADGCIVSEDATIFTIANGLPTRSSTMRRPSACKRCRRGITPRFAIIRFTPRWSPVPCAWG